MRQLLLIALLNIILTISILGKGVAHNNAYFKDDQGYRIRQSFDPGNSIKIGTAWEINSTQKQLSFSSFKIGVSFRDEAKELPGEHWKNWIQILNFSINPNRKNSKNWPLLKGTLFESHSIYYQEKPHLTLPTRPPSRIAIPFNIGFSSKIGNISIPDNTTQPRWDITAIDSRIILDFTPSPNFKNFFQFNFGVHYKIQLYEEGSTTPSNHLIAPFTAMGLKLRLESLDGFYIFNTTFDFIPTWSKQLGWVTTMIGAINFSMILIAINDSPLRLTFTGEYNHKDQATDGEPKTEWRITAGISLNYQID